VTEYSDAVIPMAAVTEYSDAGIPMVAVTEYSDAVIPMAVVTEYSDAGIPMVAVTEYSDAGIPMVAVTEYSDAGKRDELAMYHFLQLNFHQSSLEDEWETSGNYLGIRTRAELRMDSSRSVDASLSSVALQSYWRYLVLPLVVRRLYVPSG
jgi:hypothetical protein